MFNRKKRKKEETISKLKHGMLMLVATFRLGPNKDMTQAHKLSINEAKKIDDNSVFSSCLTSFSKPSSIALFYIFGSLVFIFAMFSWWIDSLFF